MVQVPIQACDERVIPFAREQMWSVLVNLPSSPRWWPASVKLKVLSASPGVVGSEMEVHPRGGRPFRCRVETVEPPGRMRIRYGNGFIVGTGEWRLTAVPGGTRVTCEWDVVAMGWLVALLGKLLPLARFHSRSMAEVLEALEQETRRR